MRYVSVENWMGSSVCAFVCIINYGMAWSRHSYWKLNSENDISDCVIIVQIMQNCGRLKYWVNKSLFGAQNLSNRLYNFKYPEKHSTNGRALSVNINL